MSTFSNITFETILEILSVVFLGLVLGSFATALIYRIPRGISWVFAQKLDKTKDQTMRSACPQCAHKLGIPDLIPFFSWLCLKGACRHCKNKIPPVYPLSELAVLCACIGIYSVYGLSITGLIMIFTMPFLVALLAIDLKHMILPNQLVFICFLMGIALLSFKAVQNPENIQILFIEYGGGALIFALFAWFLGFSMTHILKKEALGFGDVKFFAVAGLWLGLENIALFCIYSGVLGVFINALSSILTDEKTKQFPFGPALIVSFYLLLVVPKPNIF